MSLTNHHVHGYTNPQYMIISLQPITYQPVSQCYQAIPQQPYPLYYGNTKKNRQYACCQLSYNPMIGTTHSIAVAPSHSPHNCCNINYRQPHNSVQIDHMFDMMMEINNWMYGVKLDMGNGRGGMIV